MVPIQPQSILIITSSGGGGHLQAARTKALEEQELNPLAKITTVDIQLDWMGAKLGAFFIALWNNAQARGNVSQLRRLTSCQFLQEKVFWLPIFLKAFFTLYSLKIDKIIDTQPIFTSALVKAAKAIALLQKKNIAIEKIITELPTKACSHFFSPIKRLSARDRRSLKIISCYPLLEDEESAATFWEKECGLAEEAVEYRDMPLRSSFKRYQQLKDLNVPIHLTIQIHTSCERNLIETSLSMGSMPYHIVDKSLHLTLQPQERVYTLMLGSIPAEKTTLTYIEKFIQTIQELGPKSGTFRLFVFCNRHEPGKDSLLKKVSDLVSTTQDYPKNLTIIPMSFQDDTVIAPLFFRSDATFTRSGGLTSMELFAVARGQICIHSEIKESEPLSRGMPKWEYGNAAYLRQKRGAKILSIHCFNAFCRPLLQKRLFTLPQEHSTLCQESIGFDLIK